jgi:glycine hydroxymethyltransferase
MCDVLESLESGNSEQVIAEVKKKVLDVCSRFPVYAGSPAPAAMVAQG